MHQQVWFKPAIIGIAALVAVAAIVAGFAKFRVPFERKVATLSAQHALGHTKLNVLILGYQDDEATTDTIMLMHLDVDRQAATLVSIPRDTWVPVPGHGSTKINAAYAYGGAQMSAKVVSALMGGIPIDATIALQPEGAAKIVDAMGALTVNVDEDMDYDDNGGDLHIHLKKGPQSLSGDQVLGYIRFRHDGTGDFGRVRRQQQVLKVMMDQLSLPQNWIKVPHILQVARKDVVTTLGDRQLAELLGAYRNVPDNNVRAFTLPSKIGWVGDASVVFVDRRWSRLIGAVLFRRMDPPQDAVVVANATGAAALDKTLVGALRGGGWNVPACVDQPPRNVSVVIGASPAAVLLSQTFAARLRPGGVTTFVVGSDLAPDAE
jgi:polyisoprenyl-teichoic acid--peptidoglycan teichoic acid transferase